jgi:hypothetical protein
MNDKLRRRVRLETMLAAVSGALAVLTLVFPEWIEASTGLEPDAGSGALELLISATMLAVACGTALLARRDRRRLAVTES